MREFILIVIGFVLGDAIGITGIMDIGSRVIGLFG